MKRASGILQVALAALLFMQGTSLVAICAVPCNMGASQKLRCAVSSLLGRKQAKGPAVASSARECGRLELLGQIPALKASKFELAKSRSASPVPEAPALMGLAPKAVSGAAYDRAGPLEFSAAQAHLAVPPQNAPPVLA
jgi:hypothetical protein